MDFVMVLLLLLGRHSVVGVCLLLLLVRFLRRLCLGQRGRARRLGPRTVGPSSQGREVVLRSFPAVDGGQSIGVFEVARANQTGLGVRLGGQDSPRQT